MRISVITLRTFSLVLVVSSFLLNAARGEEYLLSNHIPVWAGVELQGLSVKSDLRKLDISIPLPALPFAPKLTYNRSAYELKTAFDGWQSGGAEALEAHLPFGLTLEAGRRFDRIGRQDDEFVGLTFKFSNLARHHENRHFGRIYTNQGRRAPQYSSHFTEKVWSVVQPFAVGFAVGVFLNNSFEDTNNSRYVPPSNSGSANNAGNNDGSGDSQPQPDDGGWIPVWADEFNGTELNENNWSTNDSYLRGECWGYGNSEQQCYTPREQNVSVSGGFLQLTGLKENYSTRNYTSGRIQSRGKQDFKYGRFEARIQLPGIRGTWPAFWMLPTQEVDQPDPLNTGGVYGTWPKSGEIDIMENENGRNNEIINALHFWHPDDSGWTHIPGRPYAADTTTFNTYRVDWHDDEITWFLNGQETMSVNRNNWNGGPHSVGTSNNAPFDQEFHMILNLALGGTLGGDLFESDWGPDGHKMLVDYVRVYECVEGPSGCKQ